MEMMTSWRWGIMQRRDPSWSDFKAKPHKPHSCFICFPSHWACTLKASLIPCVSWWKTMPSFLKGSLFSVLFFFFFFFSTQSSICEAVDNLIQSATVPKIHILAWFPPVAFKPPTLPVKVHRESRLNHCTSRATFCPLCNMESHWGYHL